VFVSLYPDEEEYCLRDAFNVTCAPDEVILMTSASYGRMRSGRCISGSFGHIGCMAEVTSHLDEECSGKRDCVYPVATLLSLSNPCPMDVTSYLLASHICVKGTWCVIRMCIVPPRVTVDILVVTGTRSIQSCIYCLDVNFLYAGLIVA